MNASAPSPEDSDFARLIDTHQSAVWRYLRFLGCEPAEADDLTQETFLAVIGRPVDRFGVDGARAYLRRVARNLVVQTQRRGRTEATTLDLDTIDLAWGWYMANDDGAAKRAALRTCLAALPKPSLRALELRYRDNLSRDEIAERLELRPSGVKSLLQRSYARLRTCIERRLAAEDR